MEFLEFFKVDKKALGCRVIEKGSTDHIKKISTSNLLDNKTCFLVDVTYTPAVFKGRPKSLSPIKSNGAIKIIIETCQYPATGRQYYVATISQMAENPALVFELKPHTDLEKLSETINTHLTTIVENFIDRLDYKFKELKIQTGNKMQSTSYVKLTEGKFMEYVVSCLTNTKQARRIIECHACNHLVGFGIMSESDGMDNSCVVYVGVDKDFRRKGIATDILKKFATVKPIDVGYGVKDIEVFIPKNNIQMIEAVEKICGVRKSSANPDFLKYYL